MIPQSGRIWLLSVAVLAGAVRLWQTKLGGKLSPPVAAGRSTFLDGGIQLCALEPLSGKLLHEKRLEGPYPDITEAGGTAWNMDGATSDVLVGDGAVISPGAKQ